MSHLGRPKGKDLKFSLESVADHLSKLLNRPVELLDDCVGEAVHCRSPAPRGSILCWRIYAFGDEEGADDLTFAKSIQRAVRADYFVQDGIWWSQGARQYSCDTLCVFQG